MNHTKHCALLRQSCPEPMACGHVCQVVKKDAADLPTVMFDGPYQWFKDMACTAVYAVGVVSIVAVAGLMIGYGYAKFFS